MSSRKLRLSIVIPCFNEAGNVVPVYQNLQATLSGLDDAFDFEIIYVNDGSTDNTYLELHDLAKQHDNIKVLSLSRNFGKEIAMTAGIHQAQSDAVVTIDGDGQHPPNLIPKFIKAWQDGAQVVVGVRTENEHGGVMKRYGSKMFYRLFNRFTKSGLVPGSTDYRLIDRAVQQEFVKLTEHSRMTRGLIDWLGFRRVYIPFQAHDRISGTASYSLKRLFELAVNSFVSTSLMPLYLSLYVGLIVVPLALLVGLLSAIEMLVGDPWHLHIHGTAFVALAVLFAVGVLLISQGFIALYLSRVHTEAQNRPLFVIDKEHSLNTEL